MKKSNSKLKIAFAVGNLDIHSGIVRVVRNIAAELAKMDDYSVAVICTDEKQPDAPILPASVEVYNLDIEKYGHRAKYLRYSCALRKLFRKYTPDVLIVSGMEHVLFYSAGAVGFRNIKLIAWEHRNFSSVPRFRLEWLGKRWALKRWNGILCITQKDYAQYSNHQGSEKKLYQIYNLTDFFAESAKYNRDSTRIMSCGYLGYIKGFDMLIKVAQMVFAEEKSWSWDIYGEGAEREHLQEMIAENGLEDYVHLKGYVNNINELFGEYSFFALTSRAEGMGMVLIEAQKAGLPVVSFDINCGPSDVISNEQNGYLIEPFDLREMADKILELIRDEQKRVLFSENSEMNLAEFEKDVVTAKWIEMLGNILYL